MKAWQSKNYQQQKAATGYMAALINFKRFSSTLSLFINALSSAQL